MRIRNFSVLIAAILFSGGAASGPSLIVGDSGGQLDYGYGNSRWTGFTSDLNANFASVTVVSNFENLGTLLAANSILVDQRWVDGSLSALEVANISTCIASGGISIFSQNVATLWSSNVMTLLDINVVDDDFASKSDNRQFARSTAKWLSVPTPAGLPLFAMAALGARRRRG